ncbi:O-fucosyltransferase family protein [Pseudonocardia sp. 73-21]|uniref:O-fucosyltransferase family protein n=1 Tax=Pseudonocardia sp. 73-21 TaxID=1895809 RepID=UPI00095AD70E|nr:O-fucosyltransferase family protein [Pseudonocardia sp. 73-21]OJY47102.1 MAG: hypothetical protein BGP03_11265 [Pseudonocardia sp. 73-21]
MTDARRLFFPGYYSGYSNNRMSLDIAVVLAHLTGRVLVPYRFRMPRRHPIDPDDDRVLAPMVVPDLFDLPVTSSDEHLLKTWVSVPDVARWDWEPIYESVICVGPVPPRDDAQFAAFRNGRSHVHTIGSIATDDRDLHITTEALGNYSTSFYLEDERRHEVADLMRQVRPKQAYRDAADRITAGLGTYNAIHLRRGDFLTNELSRRGISRAATTHGWEVVGNLAAHMNRDTPLVICTDGTAGEEIFGPIQRHFRHSVFLDQHLREDAAARDCVRSLPQRGEAVDALLTQLVATKAHTFAGTFFSTFTGLIHRMRGFVDPHAEALYCYDDFQSPLVRFDHGAFLPVDDGPFTWNQVRYPVSPDAYSWMREWPEAWRPEQLAAGVAPCPDATLNLPADSASLHGRALRCVEDIDGQPVLIDWTDPADHPSWDIDVEDREHYEVEIRYACPRESAGSAYTVGSGRGDDLLATVHDTGAWTSSSPWLPLGRIALPPGSTTLSVRAHDLRGLAVMNLCGLRLRPVA